MKKVMCLLLSIPMLFTAGCSCWRCQGYITDTDLNLSGRPRTVNRYWITTVKGRQKEEYEKRLAKFESRYPDVFSRGGIPVVIELSRKKHKYNQTNKFFSDLLTICTCLIWPDYYNYSTEQMVEVSLDMPSEKNRRFKAHGVWQKAASFLPSCYLASMLFEDIRDSRLAEEHIGGYGHDDEREHFWDRAFYADTHAIVLAVAYSLMEFEKQDENRTGPISVGH